MAKTTRNDLCPCGSGKKYKNCCGSDEKKKSKQNYLYLIVGLAIVLLVAFAIYQNQDSGSGSTIRHEQPGEAPPGKIWSEEHGHWHDI